MTISETDFAYRLDRWDTYGGNIIQHIAIIDDLDSIWWSQATHLAGNRDPLDRAAADAELLGDLVQTWAIRRSHSVTDATFQLGVDKRPATVLARAMPAFTRSRIIARSNSANTPIIWNMALEG